VQGVTFVTRMDYLSPIFNETGYSLAVEKLLGIEAPPRAQVIRVLCMELNRSAATWSPSRPAASSSGASPR
jgi:NADH-quinone oxidoreductase subunit D